MQIVIKLTWALFFTGFLGYAHAAPVHTLTWTAKTAAPGTEVPIGGQSFVLVRMPVKPLSGSQRYAVSFLAPAIPGLLTATLTTQHSTDHLENPIQIDGFDAVVDVSDGRNYAMSSTATTNTNFSVDAQTTCTVRVKVGATVLSFFQFFTTVQQPPTDIGETPNAVPFADWEAYVHPNAQIKACDNWIDYIRIKEVD